MATNLVYGYTKAKTRVRTLAAATASGIPVLDPADSRPAVTLTASGDHTVTVTDNLPYGWGSVTGVADGGVGLEGHETTLAYDGTWEFSGVVSSGTTPAPTSTAQGTAVYITSGGALTLASSGNTLYGHVDYPIDYLKVAGTLPVRIGS